MNEFEGFCQQGWQCPICKRVYSPMTMMCYYCGGNEKSNVVTSTGEDVYPGYMPPIEEWGKNITGHGYKITASSECQKP